MDRYLHQEESNISKHEILDDAVCQTECKEFYRSEFQTTDGFCLSYVYCDKRRVDNCGCYDRDCRPIVLLLHDIGYNATYWICLMEKLCTVANVFALDLPGAGESDSTITANLTLDKVTQYAAELLDQVCAQTVYIVGHGFGALVGMNLSLAYPNRVIKIVSASANPRPYPAPGTVVNGVIIPSDWTNFISPEAQALFAQLITPGVNVEPVGCAMTKLFDPNSCESKELLKNQYINAVNQYTIYNPILQELDFRTKSAAVTVPTLFTTGTLDPLVPTGATEFLTGTVVNSALSEFYEQGHNYPVLNKGLFNTLAFNFLFVKCDPCCAFLNMIPDPEKYVFICCPEKRPCVKPCIKKCVSDSTSHKTHKQVHENHRIVIPCKYV